MTSMNESDLQCMTKNNIINFVKKNNISIKNIHSKKKQEIINDVLEYQKLDIEKYKIIDINNNEYEYIYHLSDIHIRPLTRHVEYYEVFDNVYKLLETKKTNNIIAITGDILHEKDNLKPETIMICRHFFKKLSDYGTVVLIAGNHDILENNSDRLDNLTPIVDGLDIHYLINSGVYRFGNVAFCVSSLVDKKFITFDQIINPNNIKIIALYHGTINGSKNDKGYIIEDKSSFSSRFRKLSDFNGFNMVLLGDIHKHQYLKPNIAYSSSLIQQNFGETIKEHGLLEWDIQTEKSIFYPIENKYGFVDIHIENNNVSMPLYIPEKPYVRLIVNNSDLACIEETKENLQKKYDIQQIKIKEITETLDDNKSDKEYENENDIILLIDEMKNKNIDEERQKKILSIHKILKEKCLDVNQYEYKNQRWSIITLSFKNVFIFGDDKLHTIHFDDYKGVTSIVGPNASGKTTIINIIIFVLFGTNITSKIPNVLNKNKNNYYIECEIIVGTQKYKINRSGVKRKGDKLNHSLSLFRYENGWIKCNKETSKETSTILTTLVGNINDFLLTNVYSISSLRTILTLTPSEKHKALSTLFSLDIYESLEKLAKKDVSDIKKQYTHFEGELKGLTYSSNVDDMAKVKNKLIELNSVCKEKKKDAELIENNYKELHSIKENLKNEKNNYLSKIQKIDDSDIDSIVEKYNKYSSEYEDILKTPSIDLNEIKTQYHRLEGSIQSIETIEFDQNEDYNSKKEILQNNIQKIKDKLHTLDIKEIKYIEKLSIKNQISEIEENVENNEEKIKELKSCIQDMSFEDATNEMIEIKLEMKNIKYNTINIELPNNFDYSETNKNIQQLHELLTKKNKSIEENNIFLKECGNVTNLETIEGCTIEDKKNNLELKIHEYSSNIKQIQSLPKVKEENIDQVEKKLESIYKKGIFISQERIQNQIDILESIKNSKNIYDTINDTIILLKDAKESFTDESIKMYKKKIMLEHYKKIYYENKECIENNKLLENDIKKITFSFYTYYNSILYKEVSNIKKQYDIYMSHRDMYFSQKKKRCEKLELFITYYHLLEKQKKYMIWFQQKEKNEKILLKYKKYKDICENTQSKKIRYTNDLENNKKELQLIDTILYNIDVQKRNNTIYEKIKLLKKQIDEQIIRNEYMDLEKTIKEEENKKIIRKNNKKLQNEIDSIQKKDTNISLQINNIMNIVIQTREDIASLEKEISIFTKTSKELCDIQKRKENITNQMDELQKDISLYEEYVSLIHKNNIPSKLINKKNSYIQRHINVFLKKLTMFTITITNDEKCSTSINVHKNNITLDTSQLSGYETFILNIALKSALHKYSNNTKSTLFTIDEGLDVIDSNNFSKFTILTELLQEYYSTIFIISHRSYERGNIIFV